MTKIIKVESCSECPYEGIGKIHIDNQWIMYCDYGKPGNLMKFVLPDKEYYPNIIHPECPLEDL